VAAPAPVVAVAPAVSTTVLGAAPAAAVNPGPGEAVVTTYWTNVPANVLSRSDCRHWMALKP
jgi:hypothetical protein